MKVIITKQLEEWWGVDDLRADYPDKEDFERAVIELLMEDVQAVLDDAVWEIKEETK